MSMKPSNSGPITKNGVHPITKLGTPAHQKHAGSGSIKMVRQAGSAGTASGQKKAPAQGKPMPVTTKDISGSNGAADLMYPKKLGLRGQ